MNIPTARRLLATLTLTTLLSASPPAAAAPEATAWTTKEGTTFWATLVGCNGKDLILMARDRDFSVPVSRLSAQSANKAGRALGLPDGKLIETASPENREAAKPLTFGERYGAGTPKAARPVVAKPNSCVRTAVRVTCARAADEPAAEKETADESSSLDLNTEIVAFCKARMGEKVGNGQCATLAVEALEAAGAARMGRDFPKRGDYVWGEQVALIEYDSREIAGLESLAKVRSGDIIQFRNVRLAGRGPAGGTYGMTADHHTAVVASVDPASGALTCYHQNWGRMIVKQDRMQLKDMQSGWLRIYRPVAAE